MNTSKTDDPLAAVYGARSAQEIAQLYDRWSEAYDDDMARAGYRHPTIATALLARHLPRGAAPVLDAGAGTGLAGEWLGILGYPHVEALDISTGMLARARARGCYAALHQGALGGDLPFERGHFAGLICAGVLTTGHVGAEALPGLATVVVSGGVLVLTVKETLWTEAVAPLLHPGGALADRLSLIEATEPYVSMPGEAQASPSRAVALRRS